LSSTVVHYTDSTGFGGAEIALLTLLGGLDRSRWRSVLIHHAHPGLRLLVEKARDLGVTTREFQTLPGSRDWRWLLRFGREIRRQEAAVFHAHLVWPLACTYGLAAAALFRVPAVVATQQLFAPVAAGHDARLHKIVSIGVSRYIAVSESLARDLRPYLISNRKVTVIHNAVPKAPFVRAASGALREELTHGVPRPIVLTLARLDRQKGLSYLVEAAARVPGALFVVAGDGRQKDSLQAQVRTLGLEDRVLLLGHRDDVPDLLAACDVFVLPSLFEGLPISVLEAMAAGKPVVATRIGGTDEAVEDGVTGLLVPPRDSDALAGAIRAVLADKSLAKRLGETGQFRVKQEFGSETMVSRTSRLYEELLGSRTKTQDRAPSPAPFPSSGTRQH
jgi:glycosyltransferase involved in cell wall biosynthesis